MTAAMLAACWRQVFRKSMRVPSLASWLNSCEDAAEGSSSRRVRSKWRTMAHGTCQGIVNAPSLSRFMWMGKDRTDRSMDDGHHLRAFCLRSAGDYM
mmetsp:Transcript_176468/g.560590  ORF Transcript_176468/g.560590 Transcript_176468/m.560590 type:complete len:97 (+) Transcript_176468:848-1138(+)